MPDVGGSYLLTRAPGLTGRFLGITGYRMNAADSLHAGFADSFIAEDRWSKVIEELVSAGTPDPLTSFIDNAGHSQLATMQIEIDQIFTHFNSDLMAAEQARGTGELAQMITSALAKNAPLSMMAVNALSLIHI